MGNGLNREHVQLPYRRILIDKSSKPVQNMYCMYIHTYTRQQNSPDKVLTARIPLQ